MKNILISTIATITMSSFLLGAETIPKDTTVSTEIIEEDINDNGAYLSLGYGILSSQRDVTDGDLPSVHIGSLVFNGGYKVNNYLAVEAKLWYHVTESTDYDYQGNPTTNIDAYGLYLRPMLPIESLSGDVYALLGYANFTNEFYTDQADKTASIEDDGFSWGLGYAFTYEENLEFSLEYVSIYNDDHTQAISNKFHELWGMDSSTSQTISAINFLITYRF